MARPHEHVVPPIIRWLWIEQRTLNGPVPAQALASRLGCSVRELDGARAALKKMGFVFERVVVMVKFGKHWRQGGYAYYTGRTTLAEAAEAKAA